MTHAVCSIASGEHQPWWRWAAASAGIAALRKSGYFAMCASISARSVAGDGRRRGVGDLGGVLLEVDGVVPAGHARAVAEARDGLLLRAGPAVQLALGDRGGHRGLGLL